MRVAVHNPFAEPWVAEVELSRRIAIAARNLGWEVAEVHSAEEIRHFQPDLVLALHNNQPKLASFPTYGCMWNPPAMFEGTDRFITNIFSYDGYLISSPSIELWLHHLLCNTDKQYLKAPFYTSCPKTEYQAPNLKHPHLFYCGSNWDGPRFRELFLRLDQESYLAVYGNPKGWTHLKKSYRGSLPYDGVSVLQALRQAGVGLCLHLEAHTQAGVPSMRIFEIVASGAIAICGEHPFIRQAFGDSVLYIDASASPLTQAAQISHHMQWIAANPTTAQAMSAKAHQIFSDQFALEHLLQNLQSHHETWLERKGFVRHQGTASRNLPEMQKPRVEFIIPVQEQSLVDLRRSLDSLAAQSYTAVAALLVTDGSRPEIDTLPSEYLQQLPMRLLKCPPASHASTLLWQGLAAVQGDYCGILPDGCLHPNHVWTLVRLGDRYPSRGVFYSGGVQQTAQDQSTSIAFSPFRLDHLLSGSQTFLLDNAFILRSTLIEQVLHKDPRLHSGAVLCLLLYLCQHTSFHFSYEVTVDGVIHPLAPADWAALRLIFWQQEFSPSHRVQWPGENSQENVEQQLADALATIVAMEGSKFWKMRSLWVKLKQTLKRLIFGVESKL